MKKKEIIKGFFNGKTIDELSKVYNYTKLTITRNIKKILGEDQYQQLIKMQPFLITVLLKKENHLSQIIIFTLLIQGVNILMEQQI